LWKAKNGLVLNLRELSISTGYGYDQWRSWAYRGLPLVQGKISLRRALDWVRSEEMAPYGRTAEVYNLCDRLASALFSVWIDLEFRKKPRESRYLREEIDKLQEEYRLLRKRQCTPLPLRAASYQPLVEFEDRLPTKPVYQAPDDPLDHTKDTVVQMSKNGMALRLKELALATGYSYSTVLKWKRDGLPLVDGRITASDALAWRKEFVAADRERAAEDARLIESQIPAVLRRRTRHL
jgi:hypothetical protein